MIISYPLHNRIIIGDFRIIVDVMIIVSQRLEVVSKHGRNLTNKDGGNDERIRNLRPDCGIYIKVILVMMMNSIY